jgi:hypothetical protein
VGDVLNSSTYTGKLNVGGKGAGGNGDSDEGGLLGSLQKKILIDIILIRMAGI